MIDACQRVAVNLIVGHGHSFNAPIQRCRALIDSGVYGTARMITAMNYTEFLYRPRRPEELNTAAGGGVIHSQAAHQIDVIRLLGGGLINSVRAHTGTWDASRLTEGAYSALLGFEGGAFTSTTYSGYGHFDSDELMGNIGKLGQLKNPNDYGAARSRLTHDDEAAVKAARNYGGSLYRPSLAVPDAAHQHFGQLIVSCDRADLRPDTHGVAIYADHEKQFEALPAYAIPRAEVIDELVSAVRHDHPATAASGRAPPQPCVWPC